MSKLPTMCELVAAVKAGHIQVGLHGEVKMCGHLLGPGALRTMARVAVKEVTGW